MLDTVLWAWSLLFCLISSLYKDTKTQPHHIAFRSCRNNYFVICWFSNTYVKYLRLVNFMKKRVFFDSRFQQLNNIMSAWAWLWWGAHGGMWSNDGRIYGRGHITGHKVRKQFGVKPMPTTTHSQQIIVPEEPTSSSLKAVPSVISGSSTGFHFLRISPFLSITILRSKIPDHEPLTQTIATTVRVKSKYRALSDSKLIY